MKTCKVTIIVVCTALLSGCFSTAYHDSNAIEKKQDARNRAISKQNYASYTSAGCKQVMSNFFLLPKLVSQESKVSPAYAESLILAPKCLTLYNNYNEANMKVGSYIQNDELAYRFAYSDLKAIARNIVAGAVTLDQAAPLIDYVKKRSRRKMLRVMRRSNALLAQGRKNWRATKRMLSRQRQRRLQAQIEAQRRSSNRLSDYANDLLQQVSEGDQVTRCRVVAGILECRTNEY